MAFSWSSLFYEFCRIPIWTLFNFGFSFRYKGGANVPSDGAALLVANHQSFFDPVAVGLATSRRLAYLGRSTLFDNPLFAKVIRSLGCIPINQVGFAREGLMKALEALEQGEALLLFPEGSRTFDGKMQPLKSGIRLLVRRAKVPVIPVGIAGAYESYPRQAKFPRPAPVIFPSSRGRIGVEIGEPISPEELNALSNEELLTRLYDEIYDLQLQAERLRRPCQLSDRSRHPESERVGLR